MRNRILWTLFFVLATGLCSNALADERILSFKSNVKVNGDATIRVSEEIKVRAEGKKIRHGIYRDFPTKYKDRWGNNYTVGFNVVEVLKDGIKENYFFEPQSNGQRVYIGEKNYLINPGEYTYTITYETNRQIGFFKDHDEFYWNVTGNGWEFPIDFAQATVELPAEASSQLLSTDGFTGPQWSIQKNFSYNKDFNGALVFTTMRPLVFHEGLTILMTWPKGIIAEPTWVQKVDYFIKDNALVLWCLLGLLFVLAYHIIVWTLVGMDPPKGTIIPLYEPPEHFSPAVARYIIRMGFDDKIFASTIINLAVKGALTIHEEGAKKYIRKTTNKPSDLSEEESAVLNRLFNRFEQLEMDGSRFSDFQSAQEALKKFLNIKINRIYFISNQAYFIGGLFLSLFTIVCVLFLQGGTEDLSFIFLLMPMLLLIPFLQVKEISFVSMFLLFASLSMISIVFSNIPFPYIVFIMIILFINSLFFHLLKAPTISGRKIMDKIEGFRMYLSVAEKDRLNALNPPEETPQLFEKYLPYAIALGVEQKWAEKFSNILANASMSGQAYAPTWYYGPHWGSGNLTGFSSHLGTSFSHAIAAASSAPGSSSGGGGGGFSGGGGGGGGGGGW